MSIEAFVITDIICIVFAFFESVGNILVLYLFITKRLDSKRNLRIFLYLAIADLLFGILICPYILYMIIHWHPDQLDYDPIVLAVLGMPLPIFFKITGCLSCGAAVERILALFFPIFFRKLSHVVFSNIVIFIAILLSAIDLIFSMLSYKFYHIINCASIGCFVNDTFRLYWGMSNLAISIGIVILSLIVFLKIRQMKSSPAVFTKRGDGNSTKNTSMFSSRQSRLVNSTTSGVLISSLFCSAIPSLFVSLYEKIAKVSFFEIVGPFYVVTLLASGLLNSCIFLVWNYNPKQQAFDLKKSSDFGNNTIAGTGTGDSNKNKNTHMTVVN